MITEEQREIIRWLNSIEGRVWSKAVHKQDANQIRMFCLKYDAGGYADNEWTSWGRVGVSGGYVKPKPLGVWGEKGYDDV